MVIFLVGGLSTTLALVLVALNRNLDFFYSPAAIAAGQAPVSKRIRAGGMVLQDSLVKASDSLRVEFSIGDLQGLEVRVFFEGILPDLFREGQGVVVTGRLTTEGFIEASQVLAKHDENYMPRELAEALEGYHPPTSSQAYDR